MTKFRYLQVLCVLEVLVVLVVLKLYQNYTFTDKVFIERKGFFSFFIVKPLTIIRSDSELKMNTIITNYNLDNIK